MKDTKEIEAKDAEDLRQLLKRIERRLNQQIYKTCLWLLKELERNK